jgi:hypothetical protein
MIAGPNRADTTRHPGKELLSDISGVQASVVAGSLVMAGGKPESRSQLSPPIYPVISWVLLLTHLFHRFFVQAMQSAEFRFPQTGTRAHHQNRVFVRSYMACEPCRRTKAKCEVPDEGGPCFKCRREQRECLFSAERSSKKRRKTGDSTRVSATQIN